MKNFDGNRVGLRDKIAWIRKHGLVAYLTWATFDEGIGRIPLRRSARFWRWVLYPRFGATQ